MTDTCKWHHELCEYLNGLLDLEPNWDSYGGLPPTKAAVDKAKKLVGCISFGPDKDGGITLEVDFDKVSFFLEIDNEGKTEI